MLHVHVGVTSEWPWLGLPLRRTHSLPSVEDGDEEEDPTQAWADTPDGRKVQPEPDDNQLVLFYFITCLQKENFNFVIQ